MQYWSLHKRLYPSLLLFTSYYKKEDNNYRKIVKNPICTDFFDYKFVFNITN